jgi:hypothetical protein
MTLERVSFFGSELRNADFRHAKLGYADFTWAILDEANFEGADLRGATFHGAQLSGVNFARARLAGVNLREAESLRGTHWWGAILGQSLVLASQLRPCIGDERDADDATEDKAGAYNRAADAYATLRNNFASLSQHRDASWAYVREQQMKKRAFGHRIIDGGPTAWKGLLGWLWCWVSQLLTGYGEAPWAPVIWGVVTIWAFAVIYASCGLVAVDFNGDLTGAQGSQSLGDSLTFSIATFFTMSFNTMEPLGPLGRILTAVESALGIGAFGLFLYTLGNRISRA